MGSRIILILVVLLLLVCACSDENTVTGEVVGVDSAENCIEVEQDQKEALEEDLSEESSKD